VDPDLRPTVVRSPACGKDVGRAAVDDRHPVRRAGVGGAVETRMRIPLPSGTAAEIARPDPTDAGGAAGGAEPARGLVLMPDIMGLRPLFDGHCARLAQRHGLVVVAPEPFPGHEARPLAWRMEHLAEVSDTRRLGDVLAAAEATGMEDVGIVGFCMGGMYALKAAGTGRFSRAVSFYGMIRVPARWKGDDTVEPLDAVTADGACPVLELAGTSDSFVPEDDMRALEAAGGTVVRYEGADHGFAHDPGRPTHRAADAADAWRRALAFLGGA
jgi:carboxymethylenebutenolidase